MNRGLLNLRARIDEIDSQLLDLLKARQDIVGEISKVKAKDRTPLRDFEREKVCIENAKKRGKSLGLSPSFVQAVMLEVIRASVTSQEQDRVSAVSDNRKALIVGGFGKMGQWFGRFLESQGFCVDVYDPVGSAVNGWKTVDELEQCTHYDVIVVATPLHETNEVLIKISQLKPKGLIFDIASLKSPVRHGLLSLATSGLNATSLHPMFGPNTELLSGRHIILVSLGNRPADEEAKALFEPTAAKVVSMDAKAHDKTVSFLLGLSHALNIIFFTALKESGEVASRLMELSSTTFDAQLKIAARVAQEDPKLYFEIQALNPYRGASLDLLEAALDRFRRSIEQDNFSAFNKIMQSGRQYLQGFTENA